MADTKLNNIWLEGRKIIANVSKYQRREAKLTSANKVTNFRREGDAHRKEEGVKLISALQGPLIGAFVRKSKKSFVEVLKGNSSTKKQKEKEACKTFFFKSNPEDKRIFEKAKVGVMKKPGSAYSVSKSLMEEGIFTIQAIPLGPNLCLLKESVEGELDLILEEGGEWKNAWCKEVRQWEITNVECSRATRVSIFGVPCYVRNKSFFGDSVI